MGSLSVMVISFNEVSGQQDCEGNWVNGKCIDHSSRKRRSCEVLENGVCMDNERKRRSNDCKKWENGVCMDNERKRRSTCENGVWINGAGKTADRKRSKNE